MKSPKQPSQTPTSIKGGGPLSDLIPLIMETFVAQSKFKDPSGKNNAPNPFLHWQTAKQLLKFRLVSKAWCASVTPVAFHSICLDKPRRIESILDNWARGKSTINADFSPVQRLAIKNLSYKTVDVKNLDGNKRRAPVSTDLAIEVITTFKHSLTTLYLEFGTSIGFQPGLIDSIQQLKNLKNLTITTTRGPDFQTGPDEYSESLANLLNVLPNLEVLRLDELWLGFLDLQPQALSKLRSFRFAYCQAMEVNPVSHLFNHIKDTVKVLDSTNSHRTEKLEAVLKPLIGSLEGLVTEEVPGEFTDFLIGSNFPKLRVVQVEWPRAEEDPGKPTSWLGSPMFQNVRTLIVDHYRFNGPHFEEILSKKGEGAFVKPPNLKHVVFIQKIGKFVQTQREKDLAKELESHGIQCHYSYPISFEEILGYDESLNGPMN
ncbi:uncharacterized protein MELLADRAFT_84623 [Melampsora larici-populina 98AG31]|uniref:F-box domain-containing protein n=1 Tax=Melampsora larici-populina (strain 98AG31 / pathotype 3-4-7) TaxID=747676 RepID=F4RFX7_MELLP|nr:uncharacterized protein MELLADRAFT_84623 [Melampsora larici-populina 98AG31]EGG08681.1 hypothetical protein MELLADRAFT_84623 [Melampsora larici-populina 98AG31]